MINKRLKFILDRKVTIGSILESSIKGREEDIYFTSDEDLSQYGVAPSGVTGSKLLEVSNRLCNILETSGVRQFDRVAIWKKNSLDYFLWSLSVIRRGGISVPINGRMPVQDCVQFAKHCGVLTIVTDVEGAQKLAEVSQSLGTFKTLILTNGSETVESLETINLSTAFEAAPTDYKAPFMDRDQPCLICHTSGTTGFPKGVVHGTDSLILAAKGQLKIQPMSRKNKILYASWMNHHISQAGCLTGLAAGMHTHILTNHEPEHILHSIEKEKANIVLAFADVYQSMCQFGLSHFDLSSVRAWISSGDPMHEVYTRQLVAQGAFLRFFGRKVISSLFMDFLGSSEVGFGAIMKLSEERTKSYGRLVGRPTPASPAVRIGDAEGRPVPAHTIGRIMVKGPTVFKGYWNHHDKSLDVTRNRWFWTGDVGYSDRLGRFYHLDRDADIVMTSQGAVYGLPIEEEALKLPGVIEAALVSRKSAQDGTDEAIILLQMKPGSEQNNESLLKILKANCSWAKNVSSIEFTSNYDPMPRGVTGKVLKSTLRAQLNASSVQHSNAPVSMATPDKSISNV